MAFAKAVEPPKPVVRTDSAPGWSPSAELQQKAASTAIAFLAAADTGHAKAAHGYFSPTYQQYESPKSYATRVAKFNSKAGRALERRLTHATWSKDPPSLPEPGVYVAFDLVSRFAKIDRHCGYIVLFQSSLGGDFQVVRVEETYMDNMTAKQLAAKKSQGAVDEAWAAGSSSCPNYEGFSSDRSLSGGQKADR
ncbi:MAG: DUF4019 domain-containing protein [Caulobacteraceae bacterium]|nr:DUF4019 domain-containing protein [Caulobacteraceae bacterium]